MSDPQSAKSDEIGPRAVAVARLLWVVLTAVYIGVFLAAIPFGYASNLSLCTGADCPLGELTPHEVRLLQDLGLSHPAYAAAVTALDAALLVWALLGIFIFLRRSQEGMGLLVSLALIAVGVNGMSENVNAMTRETAALAPLYFTLSAIAETLLVLLFFVFPDGRMVPRWTRYAAIPLAAVALADPLWALVAPPLEDAPGTVVGAAVLLVGLPLGAAAQVQRYRRHASLEQRQQAKWVIYGFIAILPVVFTWFLATQLSPPSPGPGRLYFILIGLPVSLVLLLVLPVTMTVSILRHRLFDIDIIIKRTLVYVALTVSILAVYFLAVVSLQGLFRTVIEQGNQLAIVASTLLIAALFNPLRQRVQSMVNRRFYRGDYDAARTLSAFGESVRDEVDLDHMQSALLNTVQKTMYPTHLSLWMREAGRGEQESR